MKKNSIIIASAISALPFVVWGVKAVIKKDPLQKIKDALMKQDLYMKDDMQKAGTHTNEEAETSNHEVVSKSDKTSEVHSAIKDDERVTPKEKKTSTSTGTKNAKTATKDKIVAKTDDGQNIYEGSKGGRYTIGANGKKLYVKKYVP